MTFPEIFNRFTTYQLAVGAYFGVEKGFAYWQYPFSMLDEEAWFIRHSDLYYGEIKEDDDWDEPEATYAEEVIKVYEGADYVLVLTRSQCGGADNGMIFAKAKEYVPDAKG